MNMVLLSALNLIVNMLIGSSEFKRIYKQVMEWDKRKLEGAKKREGVLDALEVIGLTLAPNLINLAIEMAVVKLKATQK